MSTETNKSKDSDPDKVKSENPSSDSQKDNKVEVPSAKNGVRINPS